MYRMNVREAQAELERLIQAAVQGEEVIITREDVQVRLVPVAGSEKTPRFGSARGRVRMAPDFDAPVADFDPYTR